MLKMSRLADYATIIMNTLTTNPEQIFSSAEVAKKTHITTPTVSKVLKMLSEAKLVSSVRGNLGGYKMARAPQEITLIDIIAAIDGQLAVTECNNMNTVCTHDQNCALKHNWRTVNQVFLEILRKVTLADMNKPLSKNHLEKLINNEKLNA